MTLIVGLHCGDHVLLAADSGVRDLSGEITTDVKLDYAGGFAWGFSGFDDLGDVFMLWMTRHHKLLATLGDWRDARARIRKEVDRINRERLATLARCGQIDVSSTCQGIVAGFVGGTPSIVGVPFQTEKGFTLADERSQRVTLPPENDDIADDAYASAVREDRWSVDQTGIEVLINRAIDFGHREPHFLRRPVRVLRVTASGSSDVSGQLFRDKFPSADKGPSAAK